MLNEKMIMTRSHVV